MIAWVHILIRRIILMAIDLDTNQKLQQTQFYRNLRKQFIYWRKKSFTYINTASLTIYHS